MIDAFAGLAYSFFGTLAILLVGKAAISLTKMGRTPTWNQFRKAWGKANVFKFDPGIEDRLRATEQHSWEDAIPLAPAPIVPNP